MINAEQAIQNWVEIFNEATEKIPIKTESPTTPTLPDNKRWPKNKPVREFTNGKFSTIRKAFTTGIKSKEFLSALNPENGTYFGLKTEPTHTTKERLVMFGDTIGAALDARKSFTFQCVNRKERNELVIVAATMLTGGWIIKLNDLAVSAEPSQGQKVLLEEKRFEGCASQSFSSDTLF